MIKGIGTDLLDAKRIKSVLERQGQGFIDRILTPNERIEFEQSNQQAQFLAKRFAIKEACSKALGTGIAKGIGWQSMQLNHDALGKPEIILFDGAKKRAKDLGVTTINASLSDEGDFILAFVTLS
jgi:holo-[acyl-carrier protein] synthase